MLANGMVPALYSEEERDKIVTALTAEAKKYTGAITK